MWEMGGRGSVWKAREGYNFSWGFGYMRQQDESVMSRLGTCRSLSAIEVIGVSTNSKHFWMFICYLVQLPTQHAGRKYQGGRGD